MGAPYRDSMPFTIQDVLNNLGLPVKAEKRGVLILDCPFCLGENGQPDRYGHMEIDLARDRYRCHRCGRMGGKLDLYIAGHLQVLDTKQAYREMMEYLEGPRKGAPRFIPQALSLLPSLETEKRASAQQLHETYSALLEMLTLTSTHRQNLRDRGWRTGRSAGSPIGVSPLWASAGWRRSCWEQAAPWRASQASIWTICTFCTAYWSTCPEMFRQVRGNPVRNT